METRSYRILVVEPDRETAAIIQLALEDRGHVMQHSENGRDGLFLAASEQFQVMVCRRSLPDELDGITLVRTLRSQRNPIAAIILSDNATAAERIEGLQAGSDDYQRTPLETTELIARIEALGRRGNLEQTVTRLMADDLELDLLSQSVRRAGRPIELLQREYDILRCLLEKKGEIVTRTMLLETVWNISRHTQTNMIEVHISCLRQKVDKPFAFPLIQTVRGAGYMIQSSKVESAPLASLGRVL